MTDAAPLENNNATLVQNNALLRSNASTMTGNAALRGVSCETVPPHNPSLNARKMVLAAIANALTSNHALLEGRSAGKRNNRAARPTNTTEIKPNPITIEGDKEALPAKTAKVGAYADRRAKNRAVMTANTGTMVGGAAVLAVNPALIETNARLLQSNAEMMRSNHSLRPPIAVRLGVVA